MNKYETAFNNCSFELRDTKSRILLQELVERTTHLDNIMNTPVENLTREEYDIRNAYIYIKEALDWSDSNDK